MPELSPILWRDQKTRDIASLACKTYGLEVGPFSRHLLAALLAGYTQEWEPGGKFAFYINDTLFRSNYANFGQLVTQFLHRRTENLPEPSIAEEWLRNHTGYFHDWPQPSLPRPITEMTLWYVALRDDSRQDRGVRRLQSEPKSIPPAWWEHFRQQAWIVPNDWVDPDCYQLRPVKYRRRLY